MSIKSIFDDMHDEIQSCYDTDGIEHTEEGTALIELSQAHSIADEFEKRISAAVKEAVDAATSKLIAEHVVDKANQITEAEEETRVKCAEALDVEYIKRGSHLMEWQRKVILNAGKGES